MKVKVHVTDRETKWVKDKAICVRGKDEVLVSRELTALIRLLPNYKGGVWRLKDNPQNVFRKEVELQYWSEKNS